MRGIRSQSVEPAYELVGNAHDGATGHMAVLRPHISRPLEINGKLVLVVYKHHEYSSKKQRHIYRYERTTDNDTTVQDTREG